MATTQSPVSGSYTGQNAMGLFETLTPAGAHPPSTFVPLSRFQITLTASVDGHRVASLTLSRLRPRQIGVTEQLERPAASGIYGDLYLPKSDGRRHPAVLVFGGSEGGLSTDAAAALLAAHGYPALALAYFDVNGLPRYLENIPLEYFAKALRLLAAQPGVDPARLLVWGTSRGSEAALLLGVHYPTLVHGVIAAVPSSVANPGLPDVSLAAWTFGGKAVPTVSATEPGEPTPTDSAAIIPVEQIAGPVFLVCGGDDELWPSCDYSDAILARLQNAPNPPVELRYQDAGHFVGLLVPYLPATTSGTTATGDRVEAGGSPTADGAGRADAWPKLLAFVAAAP